MEPFIPPEKLELLIGSYPNAEDIVNVAFNGTNLTRRAIASQWLSEGIPFAFKDNPWLFEVLRDWLARRLDVSVKNINMVGSARIGQSLASNSVGRKFNSNSDLDFFVVSETLFNKLSLDLGLFASDLDSDRFNAVEMNTLGRWNHNKDIVSKNIKFGFIDPHLIPNLPNDYINVHSVLNTMSILHRKLKITEFAPVFSDKPTTIRCYKSWGQFIERVAFNLRCTKK